MARSHYLSERLSSGIVPPSYAVGAVGAHVTIGRGHQDGHQHPLDFGQFSKLYATLLSRACTGASAKPCSRHDIYAECWLCGPLRAACCCVAAAAATIDEALCRAVATIINLCAATVLCLLQ